MSGAVESRSELDALLALVATHTSRSVLICDAAERILWVNQGFTRLTGYTLEEVRGRTPASFLPGPGTDPRTRAWMHRRFAAGLRVDVEVLNYTKDGRPQWVATEVQPVQDASGRVTHFIGMQIDVTETRKAREALQEQTARASALAHDLAREKAVLEGIISTIPHAVFWKDRDSRFLGCNQTLARLGGLASPRDIVGRTDHNMPWRDQADDYRRDDRQVIESGRPKLDIEEVLEDRNGRMSVLLTSKVPLRNERGEVDGVLGVFADITEHKNLERQLSQARKLESIGQLAAGIAHEINTPTQYVSDNTRFAADALRGLMAPLRDLAELAAKPDAATPERVAALFEAVRSLDLGYLAAEVPRAMEQSLDGLEQIARIVRAMKDFSHPGEEMAPTDLNAAIASTITVARHEWKYVADVETDFDPELGPVPCRAGDIKQAVLNMVVNAAHAIQRARGGDDASKGTIRISTRRAPPFAEIRIADDGCGMSAEIRSRIFDPFFTTKGVGQGTGQGLAIAHSVIVKTHGGTISVATEEGRGATFLVRLPLDRPAPAGSARA